MSRPRHRVPVTAFVLLSGIVACAVFVMQSPAVRTRVAALTGADALRSSQADVHGARSTTVAAGEEAGGSENGGMAADADFLTPSAGQKARESSALRRDRMRREGEAIAARGGDEKSGPPDGSAAAQRRARAAMLRPSDYAGLIAAVREEFRIEGLATPETELAILRRAAESGKPDALLTLGLYLAYATEGGGDPILAAELFRRAHAGGSSRALAELGRLHLTGTGLPLDTKRAAAYFEQARSQGDAEGTFLLAMANRLELFDGADPTRARELVAQAADRGHVGAQTTAFMLQDMGVMDFGGLSVTLPWLEAAAQRGDARALEELSTYYRKVGRVDDALAAQLAAAEAGSLSARESVALGAGGELSGFRSLEESVKLVREMTAVPELADGRALFLRAFHESLGLGTGTDAPDVMHWLRLAEDHGDKRAAIARIRLERGDNIAAVFLETGPMDSEAVYLKLIELDPTFSEASETGRVPPRPVSVPLADYPTELAATRQHGRVVVAFTVDTEGRVTDLKVVEASHPAFAAAALESIARWRFTPGRKNGKPVPVKMKQPVRFEPR